MGQNSYVIGITGGTGAGKTRLVNHLVNRLPAEKVTVLNQDNYYRPRDTQPVDDKGVRNFDTLESLDPELMEADLRRLLSGKGFKQKIYHFNNPEADNQWREVIPAPILIVEGLYSLCYPNIFSLTDMSIFIETSEELMLQRRIDRDLRERGYDREDVMYRFHNHFLPTYRNYVLPLRERSSIVISNNGDFNDTVSALESSIRSRIDFLNE